MGMAGREHSGHLPISLLKKGHARVLAKFWQFPYRFSYNTWQEILSSKLYFFEKGSFKVECYDLISLFFPFFPFFFLVCMKNFQVTESQNYRVVWIGRDIRDHFIPTHLLWSGTSSSR